MAKSLMHWLKNPITPLKKDVKLLKITEVDGFYRSNPFILSGYRQAKFLYSGRHLLLQALGSQFYQFSKLFVLKFLIWKIGLFSSILLHSGMNSAWKLWLSARFSVAWKWNQLRIFWGNCENHFWDIQKMIGSWKSLKWSE